jgi:hypothetical protein
MALWIFEKKEKKRKKERKKKNRFEQLVELTCWMKPNDDSPCER